MRHFLGFLWAVGSQWVWLMSGLASVIVALWQNVAKKQSVSPRWFWIIAASCLFFAFFFAWRKEHLALEKERKENMPALVGEILSMGSHPLPDLPGTGILIMVKIGNRGSDSVAHSYNARASFAGKKIAGTITRYRGTLTLTGEQGTVAYEEKDQIFEKTYTEPIKRGTQVVGLLWACFKNMNLEDLDHSSIEIDFLDINERKYEVKIHGPVQTGSARDYFPGLLPKLPE